jgi:hypothetical protein
MPPPWEELPEDSLIIAVTVVATVVRDHLLKIVAKISQKLRIEFYTTQEADHLPLFDICQIQTFPFRAQTDFERLPLPADDSSL